MLYLRKISSQTNKFICFSIKKWFLLFYSSPFATCIFCTLPRLTAIQRTDNTSFAYSIDDYPIKNKTAQIILRTVSLFIYSFTGFTWTMQCFTSLKFFSIVWWTFSATSCASFSGISPSAEISISTYILEPNNRVWHCYPMFPYRFFFFCWHVTIF